jgi:putative transposase
MLNEEKLAVFCDHHKLSPLARQIVNQVRNSPPTRRVKSGAHNVASRFASRKMGMTIQAESHKNELPAVVGWEHDPKTFEFYDQPPKIKLSYLGQNEKRITYLRTPDYFLLQDEFVGWVECKTEEWLQARAAEKSPLYILDTENGWRCPPAEEYAASFGLGFQVRSSSATCWTMIRNLEFLSDYLDARCPEPDPEAALRTWTAFDGRAWIPLKELLDNLSIADADIVFKMIADDQIHVQLDQDLLAEPEKCIVFRDQRAAEAYRIHLDSQSTPALPSLQTLVLTPGQWIHWDGRVWKILNVGNEDVYFEDSEHVITSLRKTVFEQLVKDGVIKGQPSGITVDRDRANELVSRTSPRDFEGAMQRYRCIFPEKFSEPTPVSCERARRKWRALFKRGQELYGSGLLGLLPKIHLRGNRERRLDEGVIDIMDSVIDDIFAQPGQRTLVSCWGEVRIQCEEAGLLAPSEIAFRDQIKRRNQQQLLVIREGEKAGYSTSAFYWHLDRATPRHGERPFEIGHIDHTQLDLQFVGSRKGEQLDKAWLTVLLDADSRSVLSWVILFDAPSYRSCMAVIRECIRRHGRIPKTIVVDKGSDFESTYFEVLLARLDSHKKTRPGSKPRFGSVIERFFGVSNDAFVHNLRGNNQALQKPRQMSKSHDPRDLAVWTLPAFNKAFEGFLDQVYSVMEHPALGMSPKEALAIGLAHSGMRQHVLIPDSRDLTILCLPSTPKGEAKVDSGRGIKIGYLYYWAPIFRDPLLAKKTIPVRYDPYDASVAFAWVKDHWAACQSEYSSVFQGCSEKEIATATQELRARAKRTGKRRAINAAVIAAYLRGTSATEATLEQRLRDLETQSAQEQHARTKPNTQQHSELDELENNVWTGLDAHIFGELE